MVQAASNIRVPTLGVILARGGSKGLPKKHTRMLMGKPVIAYSIEAALSSRSLDKVLVTSDDPEVRRVARDYGVWVLERPEELATDTATVDAATRYAVDFVQEQCGFTAGAIALLYGNIPIRPTGLIDMAMNHLLVHGGDSVQSYSPVGKMHPDWMVRLDEDRVVLNCPKPIYRRQDLTPMFVPNGAVVAVTRESLYRAPAYVGDYHCFLGQDRRGVVHPESDLIVDIDERRDLFVAEAIMRFMQENQDNAAKQNAAVLV